MMNETKNNDYKYDLHLQRCLWTFYEDFKLFNIMNILKNKYLFLKIAYTISQGYKKDIILR